MIMVMCSVVPIYFGFAYSGTSLFQSSDYFNSLKKMIILLNGISAGDEVNHSFVKATKINNFWGLTFFMCYNITFFIIIQKVFIWVITSTFMKEFRGQEAKRKLEKQRKFKKRY